MIKQTALPIISNVYQHLHHIADDPMDLPKLKKCDQPDCQQAKCSIGCRNCCLSNSSSIKYYFKEKLNYLRLQTVDYKSHFKKSCFNCSANFHCSCYEDGHFNLQKMFDDGRNCSTCEKYYTKERSFYHKCNICNRLFDNCRLLFLHRGKDHQSKQELQCGVCYQSLSRGFLSRHVQFHTLRHPCPYCNKRFPIITTLKLHILSHTGVKSFSCKYCPKQFARKQYLDYHLLEHHGGKKFKCDFCHKTFARQFSLNRHKLVHMEKSFQCKYCHKQYKSKWGLEFHLFKHTGGKEFKCDMCDKSFGKQFLLNKHKSIHMDQTFQCKHCPKEYKSKQNFEHHLFEHNGGKNFKCDMCNKTFAKLHLLNRHKLIHMEKSFQCIICSNFFKTFANLSRHVNQIHKESRK